MLTVAHKNMDTNICILYVYKVGIDMNEVNFSSLA